MAKHRFGVAKSDSLFQKSFLCFTGKFNWMRYANDCMITLIFPSGLKANEPVLAYWQWDIDAKGEHSKAELKGAINVVGQESNPPFIRILKGDTYYWFEGEIYEGDKTMKLVMWDQSHKTKSEFQVALTYSK